MSDAPPPRWPHLIGKGILYSGDTMSKHEQLIRDLWDLVDMLRDQTYSAAKVAIAAELEALLEKAGEKRDRRTQK